MQSQLHANISRSSSFSTGNVTTLKGGELFMAKPSKIGRDAGDGRFIPVKEAVRRPKTAIVETIKRPKKGK